MNRAVRYISFASAVALFCAGMGLLCLKAGRDRDFLAVDRLEVSFTDSLRFVSEDDVRGYIDSRYGTYVGRRLDSIDLRRLEEILESRSAISRCEAWTTDDQVLHVSISQRAPVVRFMKGDHGFYVDDRGYIFPLHPDYTAPVPLVEGDIPVNVSEGYKGEAPDEKSKEWIEGVITLTNYLKGAKDWNTRIDRITVDSRGDLVLHPSSGDENFIFGAPDDIAGKLSRIDRYYSYILPAKGEGYYKYVNLKYKNQIICRQKGI